MENSNSKKRIWELDTIRGFAFILMALDHLTFDLGYIFGPLWKSENPNHLLVKIADISYQYRQTDAADILRVLLISGVFLFISGISATLSRSNFKRGSRLLLIALTLSLFTFILSLMFSMPSLIIYFGILHLLSVSMLLAPLLLKVKKYYLVLIGLLIIILGDFFSTVYFNSYLLIPFNITPPNFQTADYYPLFPFLSIYILGILAGSYLYKERKSLYKKERDFKVLNFFGRNALVFYFVHQVVLYVVLYLIGFIFI